MCRKTLLEFWLIYYFLWCINGEFVFPDVKFEAIQPIGFRASIPALPGIQLFAFHGKLNRPLNPLEQGEFHKDILKPENDQFSYHNPTLQLKPGDIVYYWIYIQHEQRGYRKDHQNWVVGVFTPNGTDNPLPDNNLCNAIEPRTNDVSQVCPNVILEDAFSGTTLNSNKWMVEQYIPTEPDYEFNLYKKDPDVLFLKNGMLCVNPKVAASEEELRRNVDLTNGCTKASADQCQVKYFVILQNPVISARIVSKTSFVFGQIEVRAKLPKGDWIYPEIYLEQVSDPTKKIWLAYSRGNEVLKDESGLEDIGGTLLFGGPVVNTSEPGRSKYLISYRNSEPISNDFHTFLLKWTLDGMQFFIDGVKYGTIDSNTQSRIGFASGNKVRLVIGLGVGGITDFPDNFTSGLNEKPWKNKSRHQIKNFFSQRNKWLGTWDNSEKQLKVDYIKVTKN